MTDLLSVWTRACHLVLDQSGRARLHDARSALNGLALGLEVLNQDGQGVDGDSARVTAIMQRDIGAVSEELRCLQALLTRAGVAESVPLTQALEWAADVATPVARRGGVALHTSMTDVPFSFVAPPYSPMILGASLIEGLLNAPRGGSFRLTGATESPRSPVTVTMAWDAAGPDLDRTPVLERGASILERATAQLTRDGVHRTLTIVFADLAPSPHA